VFKLPTWSSALTSSLPPLQALATMPNPLPEGQSLPEQPRPELPPAGEVLSVRAAQLSELLDVAAIITESFHPTGDWLAWLSPVLRLGIYQDLRQRLLSRAVGYTCLVSDWQSASIHASTHIGTHTSTYASTPARIAGTVEVSVRPISLQFHNASTVERPYLSNLAVHPDYRRHGVGAQLLLACEKTARDWGFEDLYLHVLENNQAARHLYTKLGYRLKQTDFPWITLLGQPRQLLLHKQLSPNP
jgi:ribosomal protein S18 acetylase RimI-like enzyme